MITSSPPVSPAAIAAGEQALIDQLKIVSPDLVHAISEIVLNGAARELHDEWTRKILCESTSAFHGVRCTREQHDRRTPHENGPYAWMDGSTVLQGKYGHA